MASRDYVETLIAGLPQELQPTVKEIFTEVLNRIAIGRATAGEKSVNLSGVFLQGKTAAIANAEFKIAHGMDATPYLAVPVLPLDAVNAVVPQLKVTKPADAMYIYLSSPVAGVTFVFYCEA
jgi:hypothetical protein